MAPGNFMPRVARAQRNTCPGEMRQGAPSTTTASRRTSKAEQEPALAWRAAPVRCSLRNSEPLATRKQIKDAPRLAPAESWGDSSQNCLHDMRIVGNA